VAAQQAALGEQERDLHGQRVALERQQTQLATHLEDRRRKLHELREELKAERAAVEQNRADAAALKAQADRDRRRVAGLRHKLERRRRREAAVQEATLRQREQELNTARAALNKEADDLKGDRAALEAVRLRFNGDAELSRRELSDGWEQLALAQQQWEATLDREHRDRRRRETALQEQAVALARGERALAEERRHWERHRLALEMEAAGLDARVRNLRSRLPRPESEPLPIAPAVPPLAPETPAPQRFSRLADTLADQRVSLLQQWQTLLIVHENWGRDRATAFADLEEAVRQHAEREHRLQERERSWQPRQQVLDRREEELAQLRLSLEGRQLRLATEAAAWESDRYALLTELQGREAVVTRQLHLLETLRIRWAHRRRREVRRQRRAEARAEEVRRQYVDRWEALVMREAELNRTQRAVGFQEAALERYRLECIAQAHDVVAAEKRIERLRRQEEQRFAEAAKSLENEQQALLDENARLDARAEQLQRFADEVADVQQRLGPRRASREARQVAVEGEGQRRLLEVQRLRLRHQRDEQQLGELRAEVERVARVLIDGGETPLPPALAAPQAA
jgi:hypothetical protein